MLTGHSERVHIFWLSRQLLVSTLPGKFSSLPAMFPFMTLTRLSFHNLESPTSSTSSTTERATIVHGEILSDCWYAQLPLRFAAFVLSFSETESCPIPPRLVTNLFNEPPWPQIMQMWLLGQSHEAGVKNVY